jgi:hypothetical protein
VKIEVPAAARFGANIRKQIWNCRRCGIGGNVIALAQHLDGCGFKDAITTLAGDSDGPVASPLPASGLLSPAFDGSHPGRN